MLTIEHNGFKAKIKRAPKLTDDGRIHGLPSGMNIDVLPVDSFLHPLPNWIGGPGNYVVPVQPNWGLWFDWTDNDRDNTAIMPSVKGMNPITGQKTQGYGLEHYKEKCPVHGTPFKEGLFCTECNYKWPVQNYVSSPNVLWWDGFRAGSGEVRQFFFTEDLLRSIPEAVLGAKETVPAFGFCFYRPKEPRAKPPIISARGMTNICDDMSGWTLTTSSCDGFKIGDLLQNLAHKPCGEPAPIMMAATAAFASSEPDPVEACTSAKISKSGIGGASAKTLTSSVMSFKADSGACQPRGMSATMDCFMPELERDVKFRDLGRKSVEVGVGAGAKISQTLSRDAYALDSWEAEPAAVMRLYFVFEEQFAELRQKGIRDLVGSGEGFLSGLPVG